MMDYDKTVAFLQYCALVTIILNLIAYAVVNNWSPSEMWKMFVAKWDKILKAVLMSYCYIIGAFVLIGVGMIWLTRIIG
jgi:hypothetical protein